MSTALAAQIKDDHDIPIFSALFSTGAEWYLDYFQSIAVLFGIAAFCYKWWKTMDDPNVGQIMESAIAAMLIPPGVAFFLTALDPVDLLPRLDESHLALSVAGFALVYLGVTGVRK